MENNIEANIRRLIDERGLKQKFVAEKAGFSESDFNNILNRRKTFKAEYLLPICDALGVTANEAVYGIEKGA